MSESRFEVQCPVPEIHRDSAFDMTLQIDPQQTVPVLVVWNERPDGVGNYRGYTTYRALPRNVVKLLERLEYFQNVMPDSLIRIEGYTDGANHHVTFYPTEFLL